MTRGDGPIFVVGIGSQRAGSTLLSVALHRATPAFVHPLKELHYFDTVHGLRDFGFLRGRIDSMAEGPSSGARPRPRGLRRVFGNRGSTASGRQSRRVRRAGLVSERTMTRTVATIQGCADASDLANVPYPHLFGPAMRNNRVLCEITPEYMLLPDSGVRHMREVTGPGTRIILQTRERVSRLLSAYVLREIGWGRAGSAEDVREEGLWRDLESGSDWWRQQVALSDYSGAYARFSSHFDHVFVGEMEALVSGSDREIADLSEFLPTAVDQTAFRASLARRVNSFGERRFSRTLVKAVDRELAAALGLYTPAKSAAQVPASTVAGRAQERAA